VIATKLGDKKQVQFSLEFKKRQRFVQKTRKTPLNGQKVNFALERLDVKAGLHTAAKVIFNNIYGKAKGNGRF
jgi:hypothetical protein